ncbi:hypothetical protein AV530_007201 [Patagioenas fasciata monilis]|uniref:Uncharacterized protein n=1 Tax=Patagioenas fasciata monilis TaxID=372326 RepID=A0A1V4JX32_PATFA|nr:hypothetical protein AV530_007201 [Patagioenas fasciata monilis]
MVEKHEDAWVADMALQRKPIDGFKLHNMFLSESWCMVDVACLCCPVASRYGLSPSTQRPLSRWEELARLTIPQIAEHCSNTSMQPSDFCTCASREFRSAAKRKPILGNFLEVLASYSLDEDNLFQKDGSHICHSEPFPVPKPHSERAMRLTRWLPSSDVDQRLRMLQNDLLDPGAEISHQQKGHVFSTDQRKLRTRCFEVAGAALTPKSGDTFDTCTAARQMWAPAQGKLDAVHHVNEK